VALTVSGQLTPLKNLSSDSAKLAIAGPATGGTFTLSYTNNTTNKVSSTPALPFGATTAAVQSALTTLLATADPGGTAVVTQTGGVSTTELVTQAATVYTIAFGGNLLGVAPTSFFTAAGGGPVIVSFTATSGSVVMAYGGAQPTSPPLSYSSAT